MPSFFLRSISATMRSTILSSKKKWKKSNGALHFRNHLLGCFNTMNLRTRSAPPCCISLFSILFSMSILLQTVTLWSSSTYSSWFLASISDSLDSLPRPPSCMSWYSSDSELSDTLLTLRSFGHLGHNLT